MGNVLPEGVPGLDIQNVIYSYRIQKETGEWVTVFVQNEFAEGAGEGYIFRERDDWLPGSLSGTRIQKAVPVGNLPRALWGDGSIEVEGNGSVDDASVVYTYKVTPCFDPQFDPNCPGYKLPVPDIPEIGLDDVYNVFDDEAVDLDRNTAMAEDDENDEENEAEDTEAKEDERRKYRLEKAMSVADTAALFAQNDMINQMNAVSQTAITTAYLPLNIPGGSYNDTLVYRDVGMSDGKKGLRNGLAQQLLHTQMVDKQYNLTEK
jgi:hypothetical protein|tara:strand:+ start:4960 stop:5748 length:789 start_codon:yes stop_codon:yes gene_type:complete